ncbi:MAG: helix-turn-helix domain-containing protein [Verrucomicrobiota bacterium]|nr:helix-turn-helix domain-containing protein [Verrucomicrobiota bacterium]
MNTKFKSVAAAAAHLAEDADVEASVKKEIKGNTLVSVLLEMRIAKGLTQDQIAEAMKCDPSTVSRIESGNDRQLKWSDIVGYVNALKVQMGILFDDDSLPAAARIKQCVFKIDEDLKKLATLAHGVGGDDKIAHAINRFYREVLFNFLKRFEQNSDKLNSIIKIPSKTLAACIPEREITPLPPAPSEAAEPIK